MNGSFMVEGSGVIDIYNDQLKLLQIFPATAGQAVLVLLRVTNAANEHLVDSQTIGMYVNTTLLKICRHIYTYL